MGPWVSGISKKPRSGNWMPFQGARRFVFWQHWFLWRPRSAAGHQAGPPVPPPPAPLAPLIPLPEEPSLPGHHSASLPRTRIFSVFLRVCGAAPVPAALQGGLANLAAQPAPGLQMRDLTQEQLGAGGTEPGFLRRRPFYCFCRG